VYLLLNKYIRVEESNLTKEEIEYFRASLLPIAGTPISTRRYSPNFWPCTICYKTYSKFYLLWKCLQNHKRSRDFIKQAFIKDVNSIYWTYALEQYNTLQPTDYQTLRLNYIKGFRLEVNRKRCENRKEKKK